jgi:hypothetical protein
VGITVNFYETFIPMKPKEFPGRRFFRKHAVGKGFIGNKFCTTLTVRVVFLLLYVPDSIGK